MMKWNYEKCKKGFSLVKRIAIIGFVAFIIILASNKYTELTITEKYENQLLEIRAKTECLLAQHGLEWQGTKIMEYEKVD